MITKCDAIRYGLEEFNHHNLKSRVFRKPIGLQEERSEYQSDKQIYSAAARPNNNRRSRKKQQLKDKQETF